MAYSIGSAVYCHKDNCVMPSISSLAYVHYRTNSDTGELALQSKHRLNGGTVKGVPWACQKD
eukprot:13711781-Ditylum_brightwellii.AAC.1